MPALGNATLERLLREKGPQIRDSRSGIGHTALILVKKQSHQVIENTNKRPKNRTKQANFGHFSSWGGIRREGVGRLSLGQPSRRQVAVGQMSSVASRINLATMVSANPLTRLSRDCVMAALPDRAAQGGEGSALPGFMLGSKAQGY